MQGEDRSHFARVEAYAVVLLLVLSGIFVADHDAWPLDEPRVIELARSAGAFERAVPLLGGEPFLEQPPLYYWAAGCAYAVVGETAAAARAVSSLFGVLTLAVTYAFAARLGGRRAGALSALSLGLSFEFFAVTHRIVVDPALAFFVVGSACASHRGLTSERAWHRAGWMILAYAAASLAYLSKGVVGVGLSGLGFLATVVALRDARALLRAHLWSAPLVFVAVTGAYHYWVYQEAGVEGIRTVLVSNTLQRAASVGGRPNHVRPFWFYLPLLPQSLLPTTPLFLAGLHRFLSSRRALELPARRAYELPLLWLAAGVAVLSLATSKRELYLVPLLPAAAMVSGQWLDDVLSSRVTDRYARWLLLALAGALAVAALALPAASWWMRLPLALPVLGGAAVLVLAVLGARDLRREAFARGLAAVGVGLVTGVVVAVLAFVPHLDADRRWGPFLIDAGQRVPAGRTIYVVTPNEAVSGAIPFYSRHAVVALNAPDDVRLCVEREKEIYLVAIGASWLVESISFLDLEVVSEEIRPSRSLHLFRARRR